MALRLVIGLLATAVAIGLAGRRGWWLYRLITSGQPAPGRLAGATSRLRVELVEVLGQRRLLRWSVPGLAHAFTFWGFVVLGLTIIEAYGALFSRDFAIPLIGRWPVLGLVEDVFIVGVLAGLATFTVLRIRQAPQRLDRGSRFYGSHTGPAWRILGMIFLVMLTLLIYRGAQVNTGVFPFGDRPWVFASWLTGRALAPLGRGANDLLETVFVLANVIVIMAFLVMVTYSKHLHIALAPINVAAKRLPRGLGALLPVESGGRPVDFTDPGEDDLLGRGKIEDFTWKGMLDFATCTECGRCQSQCPAWHTGKPLSPKLVIMDLRDHLFAKAPYLIGGRAAPAPNGSGGDGGPAAEPALRPLVGTADQGGVIDPDVLWSCTTCGACVEQCPVDIEHVDHIVDMRRYQVLVESNFPTEAGAMLRNLENKGNPWGAPQTGRLDWAKGLPFQVPQVGDVEDFEVLFWVGCAGAFEDRAKRTTRAVATLLHEAGVRFAVLGDGETCTGDPARRIGNEFLFQMLAAQNVQTLDAALGDRPQQTIVATCPHCFNTLANEYPQLGGRYHVLHHTQLLADLVATGRLTPVRPVDGGVTYHDPCYLGRHNRVFAPPRELLEATSTGGVREMPRFAERSFCCGAGGARLWMEERIGKRINTDRVEEALGTGAQTIAVACPFCSIMLGDGVTEQQSAGRAGEQVEVVDVATVLLRAVSGSG
jgi:Fe-S oxidoreductase